jgi:hypothetical protein
MSKKTRVTLDLHPDDYARLRKLATRGGTTSAAVLRQALVLAEYFAEQSAHGSTIVMEDALGVRRDIPSNSFL